MSSSKNRTESNSETIKRKKKQSNFVAVWKRLKKNKAAMLGLGLLIVLVVVAIFADFIAPHGYNDQMLINRLQRPSAEFWLGTDSYGRCILSRIIYGSRVSLQVGFIAVGIGVFFGGILGSISGFYGKHLDNFIMRCMDVLLAIPNIIMAIAIVASLGPGLRNVMIAVGIGTIPGYARIVRASVLTIRDQEYVEAAKSVGASDFRIILKHIIPNSMAPIIVQATLGVAIAILAAAGLSFIGLGIQPPAPEWGAMLSGGRQVLRDHPHVTIFPGLAIMITIFALNLLGDGLRDALDPKLKD